MFSGSCFTLNDLLLVVCNYDAVQGRHAHAVSGSQSAGGSLLGKRKDTDNGAVHQPVPSGADTDDVASGDATVPVLPMDVAADGGLIVRFRFPRGFDRARIAAPLSVDYSWKRMMRRLAEKDADAEFDFESIPMPANELENGPPFEPLHWEGPFDVRILEIGRLRTQALVDLVTDGTMDHTALEDMQFFDKFGLGSGGRAMLTCGDNSENLLSMLDGELAVGSGHLEWTHEVLLDMWQFALSERDQVFGIYANDLWDAALSTPQMNRTGSYPTKYGPSRESFCGRSLELLRKYVLH